MVLDACNKKYSLLGTPGGLNVKSSHGGIFCSVYSIQAFIRLKL